MPSQNREAERKRLAKWRAENPEKHDRINREGGWKKRGIPMTVAKYETLMYLQNGRCAICRAKPKGRLVVDHNHMTGEVRGLLCNLCNRYVVMVAEKFPKLFAEAIFYLEKHGTQSDHTVTQSRVVCISCLERDKDSANKVG